MWEVFCGDESYRQIEGLTGFDIAAWIASNVAWMSDLGAPMAEHLTRYRLDGYLSW